MQLFYAFVWFGALHPSQQFLSHVGTFPGLIWFGLYVALRPKSTAIVMAFFLGKLEQAVNQYFVHILSLVTDNNHIWMIQRKGGEWP